MPLLKEIYENLRGEESENLEIHLSTKESNKDRLVYELCLDFFPRDSYRYEQVVISEIIHKRKMQKQKYKAKSKQNLYSVIYIAWICYNSFDTFLIENRKIKEYEKYFKMEPLRRFRKEIENIKAEECLEKKGYVRLVILNTIDRTLFPDKIMLKGVEIKNTVDFFVKIFQDKLKNPKVLTGAFWLLVSVITPKFYRLSLPKTHLYLNTEKFLVN